MPICSPAPYQYGLTAICCECSWDLRRRPSGDMRSLSRLFFLRSLTYSDSLSASESLPPDSTPRIDIKNATPSPNLARAANLMFHIARFDHFLPSSSVFPIYSLISLLRILVTRVLGHFCALNQVLQYTLENVPMRRCQWRCICLRCVSASNLVLLSRNAMGAYSFHESMFFLVQGASYKLALRHRYYQIKLNCCGRLWPNTTQA